MGETEITIERIYDENVRFVRTYCQNILKLPLHGRELQDCVIYHLTRFKQGLIEGLKKKEPE